MPRLFNILAGTCVGLLTVLIALNTGWLGPQRTDPNQLADPFPAAPLELTDHQGQPFRLAPEPRVGVTVVFFGYTHCPDACPLTLAKLARAVEEMGDNGERVRVVFVSVDPARDGVAEMAGYVESFDPRFLGLTGSEEDVAAAAQGWGVYRHLPAGDAEATQGGGVAEHDTGASDPEGGYVVDHTARSFVLDAELMVTATLGLEATVPEVVRTLESVLDRR